MPVPNRLRSLAALAVAAGLALSLTATALAQEEPSPAPEGGSSSAEPSSAPEASPAPSEALPEARPEGTWEVLAFDAWGGGLVEPRSGTTFTASFLPDGRLEGETGCGVYFGVYVVDGDGIEMRVISKGPDPCSVKRNEEAVAYSVAVDAATSWRATAEGLEMLDEAGNVRAVLGHADDEGVAGDWIVGRYAKPNGKLVKPLRDSPAAIDLKADGSVSGNTGCRLFEGLYESESDRLVIAPINTVGLPCEGDDRRQERRLLQAIDEVVFWARDDDGLVLSDGFGEPRLVLTPAPVEPGEPAGPNAPVEEGA